MIDQLPIELINKIGNYLNYQDIIHLLQVNKYMNYTSSIIKHIIPFVCIKNTNHILKILNNPLYNIKKI
jgi:hypothetical protein